MLTTRPSCHTCTIRRYSIFQDCSPEELLLFDKSKTCVEYKKGQNIFYAGQHPVGLYHLQFGKVKIYKTNGDGREHIIRLAKPGDVLGYRALLGEEEYTASAMTLENSVICCIDKDIFLKAVHTNPRIRFKIMTFLCRELGSAENRIMSLAQKTVRERLAEILLTLRHKYGMDKEDETLLNISLTVKDLANYIGVARETVVRTISDFKEEQLIAMGDHRIRILNLKAMERISNIYDNPEQVSLSA